MLQQSLQEGMLVSGPWGGTSSSGRGALKQDSWDVDAWPMDYMGAGIKLDEFVGGPLEGHPPRTGILEHFLSFALKL